MNTSFKNYLNLLWQSILFWFITFLLFFIIRFSGLKTNLEIKDPTYVFTFFDKVYYALIIGIIIGTVFSIVEFLFEKYLSKKLTIVMQILLKTVLYLVTLILLFSFIRWFFQYVQGGDIQANEKGWWKYNISLRVSALVFVIASFNFSFLKIAIEKFGKKNFINILIGRYNKPREENRIFMFLDLKDSTSIAEKLGHLTYSHFIQECFYDLNILIKNFGAEIYQYVGDEAVLTWTWEKGLKNNNCILLFEAFLKQLESKRAYYESTFGVFPTFKAGVHGGEIIMVEVGTVKKEIAFHGDVINTAARIQSMCNTYSESLIISRIIKNQLTLNDSTQVVTLENLPLKGKQESIQLFAINFD